MSEQLKDISIVGSAGLISRLESNGNNVPLVWNHYVKIDTADWNMMLVENLVENYGFRVVTILF